MQTFRRIRRSLAVLVLALHPPACYHYVTFKRMTPQQYIATEQPDQVRVTLTDGTRQTLLRPLISGGSLQGHVPVRGSDNFMRAGPPWAVSITSVQRLEVHKFDTWATVGLVIGGLALVGAAVGLGVFDAQFESSF